VESTHEALLAQSLILERCRYIVRPKYAIAMATSTAITLMRLLDIIGARWLLTGRQFNF